MYISLVNQLRSNNVYYKIDVLTIGFQLYFEYKNKTIKILYNNYHDTQVFVNNCNYIAYKHHDNYNFNDVNEALRLVDDIIYLKQLHLKIMYLKKFLEKFTYENMDYLIEYCKT
jgi:hypothetical protein